MLPQNLQWSLWILQIKCFFIIRTFLCQLFGFYFSGTVTIKSSFVIWCKFCKSSKSSKRLLGWRSLLLYVSPEAVKIGGTKLAFIARIFMLKILGLQAKKFFSVAEALVTQPMMQCQPNPTELRSMDSHIQILCRFQKRKQKVPPPLVDIWCGRVMADNIAYAKFRKTLLNW